MRTAFVYSCLLAYPCADPVLCGDVLQVDISSWRAKDGRVRQQIRDICSILCGLVVASDYRQGQQLIAGRDFKANAAWFQNVFEVGRRYKIMNPGAFPCAFRSLQLGQLDPLNLGCISACCVVVTVLCVPGPCINTMKSCSGAVVYAIGADAPVLAADKMRSEYGKLMYLLMDSAEPNIQELVEFRCVRPLKTVYSTLGARHCTAPLPLWAKAEHRSKAITSASS